MRTAEHTTVFRLNYERTIAHGFPRSGLVPMFSGSTFNRRHNAKKLADRKRREAEIYEKSELQKKIEAEKSKRKPRLTYTLSRTSGKKIRNKCAAFFSSGAKAFVTLTFLQDCTDKQAQLCLKQMLHSWRKDFGKNFNYIWVAERQQNGRVHFHVMVSERMDIPKMNARWVRIQYNAGLKFYSEKLARHLERSEVESMINTWRISRVEKKNKKDKQVLPGTYNEVEAKAKAKELSAANTACKYNAIQQLQLHINGFDIEYINNQSHLSHYLTKYVTKTANNEDKATFDFLPWGCSRRVSALVTETIIIPELFLDAATERNSVIVQKQFVRKRTGEIVEPGTIIFPTVCKNDWAITISILNRPYYHSWLWDMNKLNKQILAGYEMPVVEYDADHYFNEYCRTYTAEEIDVLALVQEKADVLELAGNKVIMSTTTYDDDAYYGREQDSFRIIKAKEINTNGEFLN